MARKKKQPEHANHERWLISYADFITLLFAFFVVMFAVSQVDSKKVGRFTESFSKAVGVDLFPQPGKGLMGGEIEGAIPDPTMVQGSIIPDELASLKTTLADTAAKESALQNVQVITKRTELVLRLADNLLFDSGNDELEDRARRVVTILAQQFKTRSVLIRVEGHTDNRPIHTARFRSNWDLSTARATSIIMRLAAEGIEPPRLSAAGYGEFRPVATNATDEGRKQNRRVDLVVTVPAAPEPNAKTESLSDVAAKRADAGAGGTMGRTTDVGAAPAKPEPTPGEPAAAPSEPAKAPAPPPPAENPSPAPRDEQAPPNP